jgi:YD repeat-containing protein
LSEKTNGNGTYTKYQYDADGNVLHLINYAPGGAINSRFDYTYNALGLETTEDTLDGDWTYTYDADGQLIGASFASTNPSVPSQNLAYNYDAMGNRITTVINGVTTAYTTNNMNEYTSVGSVAYTYDADGNLTSDGTNTYSYNSLNQLISVAWTSSTTTYAYNALGQEVDSTANGQTTQNLIDPSGLGSVVGQYSSSGTLIGDYTYGLGLTSQVTGNGKYYYDLDGQGSVAGVSNSSGVYVDQFSYLPFGANLISVQVLTRQER